MINIHLFTKRAICPIYRVFHPPFELVNKHTHFLLDYTEPIHGTGNQTFYLIDEAELPGKGEACIISLVHLYFKHYGYGEKNAQQATQSLLLTGILVFGLSSEVEGE
ncbi:hypothetical protein DPMN_096443 [Dreissena polymorpha]|uniref:Uncharacterized protein n=1 Tax=Dreissena polymorpha TaxID=45954 RepID=A0A9D4R5F7_DREPO|nr:hypothetical protein DPMN_096443 [Dreissena polymorpha]